MKIKFDKTTILKQIDGVYLDKIYEVLNDNSSYKPYKSYGDEAEPCTEDDIRAEYDKVKNLVFNLTNEEIIQQCNASYGIIKKKNGKFRKNSIYNLFVGDTGYWFHDYTSCYSTDRLVARALNEVDIEVCFESYNINN